MREGRAPNLTRLMARGSGTSTELPFAPPPAEDFVTRPGDARPRLSTFMVGDWGNRAARQRRAGPRPRIDVV
jgi:hypothetical protein